MVLTDKVQLERMFGEVQLMMDVGCMTVLKSAKLGDGAETIAEVRLAINSCDELD
jgi:hypothetical protein